MSHLRSATIQFAKVFGVVLLYVVLFEVLGFAFLRHFDLDGALRPNCGVLMRVRNYILDPIGEESQPRYLPQHTVGWINNPRFTINGTEQNNRMGIRGTFPPLHTASGTTRILCLGGSTTYGFGVNDPDSTYPALLEKTLNRLDPSRNVEVINGGLDAASSIEELMNYLFKLRYLKPDIVIIKSGGNDAANLYDRANTYSPDMANVHQGYISIPRSNPKFRFLFHSHAISAVMILVNYVGVHRQDAAMHGVFATSTADQTGLWFEHDLNYVLSHREYYHFQYNFKLLVSSIVADGAQVICLPFTLNPHVTNEPDYVTLNHLNETVMKETTQAIGAQWIDIDAKQLPVEGWIGDDCHLNGVGNHHFAMQVATALMNTPNLYEGAP